MKKSAKKAVLIHILRILHNYTSFDYPVTQTMIVNYLNDIDISCSRKTVGRNIHYLMQCGVPIKRKAQKNGGYYYDSEHDTFFVRIKIQKSEENK